MRFKLQAVLVASIVCAGCTTLSTEVNPSAASGKDANTTVFVKLTKDGAPLASKTVAFTLVTGEHCGHFQAPSATTNGRGLASMVFTATDAVQNCAATARVSAEGVTRDVYIPVRPQSFGSARIDGVSAMALVLIASFAIDRIARGLLFALAFWPRWLARFPDAEDAATPADGKRRSHLAYLVIAAVLSTVVLAGYGGIRIFAALGFSDINPILDALITGLILVGGADRTEAILKRFAGGEGAGASGGPLQISGTIVLTSHGETPDPKLSRAEPA